MKADIDQDFVADPKRVTAAGPKRGTKVPRVILHIGLAKTGSTFLQECFYSCRKELLRDHNVLFPAVESNHWHLQSMVSATPERLVQMRRDGINDREAAQSRADLFWKDVQKEASRARPSTVVLSTEYFSSMSFDEMERLHAKLLDFAGEVWAVAFVRDPWSVSVSLTQQFIRDGRFSAPLDFGYFSGQAEVIKSAEAVFGEKLVVRPYFGGGSLRTDVIADFCEVIGVPQIPQHDPMGQSANLAIGHLRMTLIAEFNRAWPQFDENRVYVPSAERDAALEWLMAMPIDDRPIILTKYQVEIIQKMAKDDMDYFESHFFGGQRLFSDYMKDEAPPVRNHLVCLDTLGEHDLRSIVRGMIEAAAKPKGSKT